MTDSCFVTEKDVIRLDTVQGKYPPKVPDTGLDLRVRIRTAPIRESEVSEPGDSI